MNCLSTSSFRRAVYLIVFEENVGIVVIFSVAICIGDKETSAKALSNKLGDILKKAVNVIFLKSSFGGYEFRPRKFLC